ncbi:hypothetical protein CR513_23818, partial [Mucuna pruriens]
MDVYGLLVYGIVLFPQIEDHIDLITIDAFLAKRDRGENPVIVELANTYYTLDYCHERNERGLSCCTSLLYLWMIAHFVHSKRKTTGFPNVPLMGTQGTIYYNLELAGYPMVLPPSEEAVAPFVIHGIGTQNGE